MWDRTIKRACRRNIARLQINSRRDCLYDGIKRRQVCLCTRRAMYWVNIRAAIFGLLLKICVRNRELRN